MTRGRKSEIEIEKIPLSELHLDKDNLRGHKESEINLIIRSLTIFGQFKPLIVDKNTMTVKIGNGRLMAMRKMGWTECDCILFDWSEKSGMEVVDNRLNELCSGWNDRELGKWFKNIGTDWWGIDDEMTSKAENLVKNETNKSVSKKEAKDEKKENSSEKNEKKHEHLCPCCGKPLLKVEKMIID